MNEEESIETESTSKRIDKKNQQGAEDVSMDGFGRKAKTVCIG